MVMRKLEALEEHVDGLESEIKRVKSTNRGLRTTVDTQALNLKKLSEENVKLARNVESQARLIEHRIRQGRW